MKKQLDLRDKKNLKDRERVDSLVSRRNRYNKAVRAMKRYNKNMQQYADRTKGLYLKHLQVPQSEYMRNNAATAAHGNSNS